MSSADWTAASAIYQEGLNTGQATFETTLPSWSEWSAAKRPDCRLVIRRGAEVLGWAALGPVSKRRAYAGVAEVSIYIAEHARGQGVGRMLLVALIQQSETAGIWTLQAVTFPENQASIALHESCGFRQVGRRERIAQLHGHWRDTILLERRSKVVI